jgi:hypothetical protein
MMQGFFFEPRDGGKAVAVAVPMTVKHAHEVAA